MSEKPLLGNPAVVGLAGFGGTTLLLQFHNLGLCGVGPVIWTGIFFGGLAQLVAGMLEFRTGNNFGFAAFTSYGAFWLALAGILFGTNTGMFDISTTDVGWFLLMFTLITGIFFIGAMKESTAHSILFLTLLLGFILLDVGHLGGPAAFNKVAAVDLIVCAISAWYLMSSVIFAQMGIRLPTGKPWI